MSEVVRAAKLAWANGTGPTSDDDMLAALRAADAARAVPDEEVAMVLATTYAADDVKRLRAAGLKVVRG